LTRRTALWPSLLLAGLLSWLIGYPLLITLFDALGLSGGLAGLSLEPFSRFAARGDEWLALWRSLWIALASTLLAAVVGVPLAFVFERSDFPGRRLAGALLALPVALPPLVGVIAFLFLFGESGFISRCVQGLLRLEEPPWRLAGPGAILLVHTYSMYVYFYLFVRSALSRLDPALAEAAAALGAGRRRTLLRVTLPMLRPALTGAALLTFMTSIGSFSAPYIFGGSFRVMTTQIVASKLNGNLEAARVETVALAALALLGLALLRLLDPGQELTGTVRGLAPKPPPIRGRLARGLTSTAAIGFTLLLLLPHATLVLISLVPPHTWTIELLPPELSWVNYKAFFSSLEKLRPVASSLWMATVATLGALALGFAAARGSLRQRRLGRRGLGAVLEGLIGLPWAIPGTVFAIALAATFSVAAPWFGRFVLVGTLWILPLAYLVRSLPVTGRSALAGLRQLDPALEEAAASLGAGSMRTLRRVVLPLIRPALAAGASLAFITALGDLVASIVLYTYNTRPISIEILSQLRLQEIGIAAVYGVVLMVASTLAFTLWGKEGTA